MELRLVGETLELNTRLSLQISIERTQIIYPEKEGCRCIIIACFQPVIEGYRRQHIIMRFSIGEEIWNPRLKEQEDSKQSLPANRHELIRLQWEL
ncbi:hypothetical protein Y1Q_0002089 [Alligator mississippiensis]|uniref:Uncharacterized protein n=1 Tax=Alligator mississippiensis TaxID=8496 RepID=A0A151MJ27_ALLMI|nr:hypothetical protein Y1Q_0002089 [Alligator mississippiensis]